MRPAHVVVVAYHGAQQLDRALAPLASAFEVTVIDNSSSHAVREVAVRHRVRYVDRGGNAGFAAGVNAALGELMMGTPRDVLLLNPDAVVTAEDVTRLAACLHDPRNGRLGAVAPRLVGPDGADQRVLWPFPSPLRAWLDAVGLARVRSRSAFVIGAVLLLRWEAVRETGKFDERFFLYAEETDWQRRALQRGWRSGLCRDVVARHVGAGTSADPRRRELLFHAAHETYIRKWYGPWGWLAYRSAAIAGAAVRAAVLRDDRRAEAARRAVLYLRGPLRSAALPSE